MRDLHVISIGLELTISSDYPHSHQAGGTCSPWKSTASLNRDPHLCKTFAFSHKFYFRRQLGKCQTTPAQNSQLEIWPQRLMYFAAAGWHFPWGWPVSGWWPISEGWHFSWGVAYPWGLTLVLTWLMAGRGHPWGGPPKPNVLLLAKPLELQHYFKVKMPQIKHWRCKIRHVSQTRHVQSNSNRTPKTFSVTTNQFFLSLTKCIICRNQLEKHIWIQWIHWKNIPWTKEGRIEV